MTDNPTPGHSASAWRCAALLVLALTPALSAAVEIDTCKHLVVAPMANDTLTLAKVLREQGGKHGFTIVAGEEDVPAADVESACTLVASWLGSLEEGDLLLRVLDTSSGLPIAGAEVRATNRLGFEPMLRTAAAKAFAQLHYRGFDAAAHRASLMRVYPPRPTYQIAQGWLATWQPRHPIEGVWTEQDGAYRLAIVPAPTGTSGTHLAVVLASGSPLWTPGEIKANLIVDTPGEPVNGTFYLLNKQPAAAIVGYEGDELTVTLQTPAGRTDVRFRRDDPNATRQGR